jgi:phosphate transport system substrate-binding protein
MNFNTGTTQEQRDGRGRWSRLMLLLGCIMLTGMVPGSIYADESLRGTVSIDGSSTVFPISEAVAEEFLAVAPRVRVTVGVSGTGGGFKKFLGGEIDINDASRPIKDSELAIAEAKGIEFIELPVAYDGLSVVINRDNDWATDLTVAELKKIWQPGSTVQLWSDIRPNWPQKEIRLYGPGTDSGTFDYFTETINGRAGASRPDYTASEDDNALVQGISNDRLALGYFGFAYYEENRSRLKVLAIDGGNGPVTPSATSIKDGTYAPLSRPIFIYVGNAAMERPEVRTFVEFYLRMAPELVSETGYIPLSKSIYARVVARVSGRQTGSAYATGSAALAANLLTDD